jgi:hypothetical protein
MRVLCGTGLHQPHNASCPPARSARSLCPFVPRNLNQQGSANIGGQEMRKARYTIRWSMHGFRSDPDGETAAWGSVYSLGLC